MAVDSGTIADEVLRDVDGPSGWTEDHDDGPTQLIGGLADSVVIPASSDPHSVLSLSRVLRVAVKTCPIWLLPECTCRIRRQLTAIRFQSGLAPRPTPRRQPRSTRR